MNKNKIKYIIVIVLYKNMLDILELIYSVQITLKRDFHIILVNNFFDNTSDDIARKIAINHGCSFISMKNKGYGAGNNAGVQFARKYFEFKYLIICNPDTVIKYFDENSLLDSEIPAIYAPKIISKDHKKQNPNWAFHSDILEYLQYLSCKHEWIVLDYIVIAILKLSRIVIAAYAELLNKSRIIISSAHGSFLVLSNSAVKELEPLYDENMFLFYEEVYLANKAYKLNIPTYYIKDIFISHKEDGSMNTTNINTKKEAHKSVVYYYENKFHNKLFYFK